jgi:cytoskeletal protein CcmA (bactofilin family)
MDQSGTEITALLGRGTRFEGKLFFEGRVRIDGQIECATVIVRGGVVNGNIRAKTSLELHAPGKLVGNIHSPSIFIDRGVEFQGTCRMDAVTPETTKSATPTPTKPTTATPS